MDDKKTVKMGSQPDSGQVSEGDTTYGGAARPDDQPTVQAGAPFVPVRPVDRPTPRPGQVPGWAPPAGFAPIASSQPRGGDAPTMLLTQRPGVVFAWLVVMDGPDKGRIHQLRPDVTTVGRNQGSSDVVIADDAVSGQHLKIKIETQEGAEDQFVLFDLASSNGTFAGDKATYRDTSSRVYRHALKDGDYLLLGETTLVFKRV